MIRSQLKIKKIRPCRIDINVAWIRKKQKNQTVSYHPRNI